MIDEKILDEEIHEAEIHLTHEGLTEAGKAYAYGVRDTLRCIKKQEGFQSAMRYLRRRASYIDPIPDEVVS